MTGSVNWFGETNFDALGRITADLRDRIRDDDPQKMFDELSSLCAHHPGKAAQMLMVLAAWSDPFEESEVLVDRVRAITHARAREQSVRAS